MIKSKLIASIDVKMYIEACKLACKYAISTGHQLIGPMPQNEVFNIIINEHH